MHDIIKEMYHASRYELTDFPEVMIRVRMKQDQSNLYNDGRVEMLKGGEVYDLANGQAAIMLQHGFAERILTKEDL